MADDRYRNYDYPTGSQDRDRHGYGWNDGYSIAREYRSAGDLGSRDDRNFRAGGTGYGDHGRFDQRQETYGSGSRDYYGGQRFGGGDRGSGRFRDPYGSDGRHFDQSRDRPSGGRGYGRPPQGYDYQDRGFLDRAGDEVRSWFGDEDAERRREFDQRYDERLGGYDYGRGGQSYGRDGDYGSWRRRQIDALDRDYDEYRRENATRFENDFGTWRNERQTQRNSLASVREHMEVLGSDGEHIGTVDKVRGDRIVLTKNDVDAGGRHHSIPSRWIQTVDERVTVRKTADEAKAHWRDEERSGALFGDDGQKDDDRAVNLNRSFSGTY